MRAATCGAGSVDLRPNYGPLSVGRVARRVKGQWTGLFGTGPGAIGPVINVGAVVAYEGLAKGGLRPIHAHG
jgi:hypothetical protein